MKKIILVSIFILSIFKISFAQKTIGDIKNSDVEITWLGIDFSEVKFIGPASGWGEISTKTSVDMRDNYFPAWNNLVVNEPNQFKIADATGKRNIIYLPEVAAKANQKTSRADIFSESINDFQLLDEKEIAKMVKKYDYKGKSGIGLIFIAEGMSKGREEASYWVVFVEMSSKKIIYTKQVIGKASGFGFRNYWAGTIKSVLKMMKKEFKNWN